MLPNTKVISLCKNKKLCWGAWSKTKVREVQQLAGMSRDMKHAQDQSKYNGANIRRDAIHLLPAHI